MPIRRRRMGRLLARSVFHRLLAGLARKEFVLTYNSVNNPIGLTEKGLMFSKSFRGF
jgi:predicted transcriptional regulator